MAVSPVSTCSSDIQQETRMRVRRPKSRRAVNLAVRYPSLVLTHTGTRRHERRSVSRPPRPLPIQPQARRPIHAALTEAGLRTLQPLRTRHRSRRRTPHPSLSGLHYGCHASELGSLAPGPSPLALGRTRAVLRFFSLVRSPGVAGRGRAGLVRVGCSDGWSACRIVPVGKTSYRLPVSAGSSASDLQAVLSTQHSVPRQVSTVLEGGTIVVPVGAAGRSRRRRQEGRWV
ncbi:hypothetical protein OH77DRAFT_351697 [Trametes cingulata]|nr:hypothetical protein OH77DRAFT_351697 [Trametes cingulata]